MKRSGIIKLISAFVSIVFLLLCLDSCKVNNGNKTVGSVGELEVKYEELYFLSKNYAEGLEAKYGSYEELEADKRAEFCDELRSLVYENIVTNHAILTLCKEYGLTLDSDGLEDRVDKYIKTMVTSEFGGSKSSFKRSLEAYGMTESYVSFTAAVDLLYSDLITKLIEDGTVPSSDEEILSIVEKEFVCTWHIMVANDEGDNVEENRKLIEEALRKYNNGTMSMYELIGSNYNEDLSVPFEGNYITKGYAEKEYEDAAFALDIGEISGIVESSGVTANGDKVSCFYLIKRLPLDLEYVRANLYELEKVYHDGIAAAMLDDVRSTLSFAPNEYCDSLDLAALEAPKTLNTGVVVVAVAASLLVIAAIAVIVVKKRKGSK